VVQSVAAAAAGSPIVAGGSIVIRGSGLGGDGTTVAVGDVVLTPAAGDVSDSQVTVALTDSRLQAGAASLVVASSGGGTSRPASFVISPTLTAVGLRKGRSGGAPSLRLTLDPTVWSYDAITVLLNATQGVDGAPPPQYAFDVPVPASAAENPKRVATVSVPIPGVASGTYLVRAQVNGAESPLATGVAADGSTRYVSPRVRVP
jgi:hypothetical protein